MRITPELEQDVQRNWVTKEKMLVRLAHELGSQLWDHDPMYGNNRNRDDHEAKVAQLGFLLGKSSAADEFLHEVRKIATFDDKYDR